LPCLCQIHSRAGGRDAQPAEFGDRVFHAIRSGVGDVIAGQRRHVKSRALERSKIRRITGRCGNVEMRHNTARRMRDFDVPYEDVTGVELLACKVEQNVGIGLVENQVAGHLQSKRLTQGNASDSVDLYT
jgi:hypothetical protein